MTSKFLRLILPSVLFMSLLPGCSGKQTADDEYLTKSAKAVIFFSTSSESFLRNLSADPKGGKSDSFERYSQLLLDNFKDLRNLEAFKDYVSEIKPHGPESDTGYSESTGQAYPIAQTDIGHVLRLQEIHGSDQRSPCSDRQG